MSDKAVLKAVFHDRLQTLVSFHDKGTLILSKLTLNARKSRLNRELMAELRVPAGFEHWDKYAVGNRIFLYKRWELEINRTERTKTELLFLDVATLEWQRAVAAEGVLEQCLVADDRLLLVEYPRCGTRLVSVGLKFES